MQIVANNIANAATTGYRAEGLVFSEFVRRTEGGPSLSMARGNIALRSTAQGPLARTGGALDLAIEGDGFFLVETPDGNRLTRAGAFALSASGDLVTADGFRVLDAGGAPVFVPPDIGEPGLAPDGTLSGDGRPLAQVTARSSARAAISLRPPPGPNRSSPAGYCKAFWRVPMSSR
jgi:flagellar basal-body rod protein FlgF